MKRVLFLAVLGFLLVSCEREPIESVTKPEGSSDAAVADGKEYVLAKEGFGELVGKAVDSISKQHVYDMKIKVKTQGQTIDGEMETATSSRTWTQVMSEDKVRETLLADKKREQMGYGGKMVPQGEHKPSVLLNMPVIYNKVEGEWVAGLEDDSKLTDEIKKKLEEKSKSKNKEESIMLYGTSSRKVGDEWDADAMAFGIEGVESGSLRIKFLRVEEFQGQQCAVLFMRAKLSGKVEDGNVSLTIEAEGTVKRSLKYLVDLSTEVKGTMTMSGSPNEGVSMKGSGKMTMEETIKVVGPKAQ